MRARVVRTQRSRARDQHGGAGVPVLPATADNQGSAARGPAIPRQPAGRGGGERSLGVRVMPRPVRVREAVRAAELRAGPARAGARLAVRGLPRREPQGQGRRRSGHQDVPRPRLRRGDGEDGRVRPRRVRVREALVLQLRREVCRHVGGDLSTHDSGPSDLVFF
ncbi:hypothetical protein VTG60DRAFT_6119 [Thermothelomyces hinnuleus]